MGLYRDAQLLRVDGSLNSSGANFQFDMGDVAYVLPTYDTDTDGTTSVAVFKHFLLRPNKAGVSTITIKANSRTVAQYKAAIDLITPNALKVYTNLRFFKGNELVSGSPNYDSSVLVNTDAFVKDAIYDGTYTNIDLGYISANDTVMKFNGSQLGTAPTGVEFRQTTANAINATATATVAQVLSGTITSTSAAAVSITLPTATALAAAINGGVGAGASFIFSVDNSAGANTVTVIVGAGITVNTPAITGGDTLTVSVANAVGTFLLYFTSTTTAKIFRLA